MHLSRSNNVEEHRCIQQDLTGKFETISRGIISVTMTKNSHHTAGPLNTKGPYSGHLISSLEASSHPPDSTGKAQPACKKVNNYN